MSDSENPHNDLVSFTSPAPEEIEGAVEDLVSNEGADPEHLRNDFENGLATGQVPRKPVEEVRFQLPTETDIHGRFSGKEGGGTTEDAPPSPRREKRFRGTRIIGDGKTSSPPRRIMPALILMAAVVLLAISWGAVRRAGGLSALVAQTGTEDIPAVVAEEPFEMSAPVQEIEGAIVEETVGDVEIVEPEMVAKITPPVVEEAPSVIDPAPPVVDPVPPAAEPAPAAAAPFPSIPEEESEIVVDIAQEDIFAAAREHHWENRLDEAVESYLEIIQAHPGNGRAFYELGEVYFEKGDFDRARGMFQEASRLFGMDDGG